MAEIYKEGRENIIRRHIRVRNLLASVALAMGHYTLLDRLNNAVSIDAVQKTIYEAARIVETLIKQGKVKEVKEEKEEGKPYIFIRIDNDEYKFYGTLPSSSDIDDFLAESIKDVRIARIIGASAMGLIASVIESESKEKAASQGVLGGAT